MLLLTTSRPSRAQEQPPAAEPELGARAVVTVTPVLGAGVDRDRVPSSVHVLGARAFAQQEGLGMPGALTARMPGVTSADVQNNPLQPDLAVRGFTASPLLGTPQGIAVYQNGVRLNEPFGDVVQWELMPEFAVQQAQLASGANPVFGLNSLGGSLAFDMKDGYGFQGFAARSLAGSFGRARATVEYGGVLGPLAVYEGVDLLREDGWRERSPTRALRLYGDLRHAGARHELGASLTVAGTELYGNGPAPVELLARDRSAVFTLPDITDNGLLMFALQGERALSEALSLQGTAYVRGQDRSTLNGDEAELEACEGGAALCDDDGEMLEDEAGAAVPASAGGDGLLNTTHTATASYGLAVQGTLAQPGLAGDNQLVVGASADAADIDFEQHAEVGRLTEDRSVRGSGVLLSGAGYQTLLDAQNVHLGLYLTDTFALAERLHVTVSGRLNHSRIELDDRTGSALDGDHEYTRFNPAAGLAYQLPLGLTVFGGYSENTRAPSAAELACADPDEPCRVPNAFLSDPPLDQVVNRSLELGVRGRHRARGVRVNGSVAGFASRNERDILFVAGSRIGTGFFRNAGRTQRLGVEVALEGRAGPVEWYAAYQWLRATFEDALVLPGDNHPEARSEGGRRVIDVEPGDRLPALPEHSGKLGADVEIEAVPGLRAGMHAQFAGAQYFRGDEANLLDPLDGRVVLGARVSYRVLPELTLFVLGENLLDSEYETFGLLGEASEVLPFAEDPRFVGPGAPLGVWVGAELLL